MAMMTKRVTVPKCVLLDANVIIESYETGAWDNLIQRIDVVVPSIIADDEALFFKREYNSMPEAINLRRLGQERRITVQEATLAEMQAVLGQFDKNFGSRIHAGELEALAIINNRKRSGSLFCSADAMAIKALVVLGHAASGISFEKLLSQSGLSRKMREQQYSESFFQQQIKLGNQILVQNLKI